MPHFLTKEPSIWNELELFFHQLEDKLRLEKYRKEKIEKEKIHRLKQQTLTFCLKVV